MRNITYVSQNSKTDCSNINFRRVLDSLNLSVLAVNSVSEIFPLLSDINYYSDLILIDIDSFDKENIESKTSVFELISTLSTLIKCTVYRPHGEKPQHRQTKIVIVVDKNISTSKIKEIMSISDITGVCLKSTDSDYEEIFLSLKSLLDGQCYVSSLIKAKLKQKKLQKEDSTNQDSTTSLTVRQRQILDMVTNRGSSNKMIAKTLKISESTVKLHMSAIFKKYGVRNRTQLAVFSKRD